MSALLFKGNEMFSLPFCKTLGFGKYPNRITGCMLEVLSFLQKLASLLSPEAALSQYTVLFLSPLLMPSISNTSKGKRGYKSQLTSLGSFSSSLLLCFSCWGYQPTPWYTTVPSLVGSELDLYLPSPHKLYLRLYTPGK